MQCILSRWLGHWRTESRQCSAPPPPTAPEAVVDNLRWQQRRLSPHHGNSRPSVDVLRVKISAKANLPPSQIPPPRRRDAWYATSVVTNKLLGWPSQENCFGSMSSFVWRRHPNCRHRFQLSSLSLKCRNHCSSQCRDCFNHILDVQNVKLPYSHLVVVTVLQWFRCYRTPIVISICSKFPTNLSQNIVSILYM